MAIVKPQKKQEKIVYQNRYSQVYFQEVDFGSFRKEYFVADFGTKAGILIVRDGSVLLARQYRLLIDQLSWEIPGGKVDKNETPQEAAIRECFEETGIRCRHLKPLVDYHSALEYIKGYVHIFYTTDFEDSDDFTPNSKEVESIAWIPLKECFAMIKEGKINDSFSILALCSYMTFVAGKNNLHE